MRAGAILCLIAGVMECILMYLFVWYTYIDGMTIYYASGLGLFKNIPYLFTNAPSIAAGMMLPLPVFYLIAVLFVVVVASPILILLGIKRRATAIIGSFFPIFLAAALLAGYFAFPVIFYGLYFMWDTTPLICIGPFFLIDSYSVFPIPIFLMGIGGIVSFIGGCLGRGPKVEVYKGQKRPEPEPKLDESHLFADLEPPKDPVKRALLTFPLDYSDLPEDVMKPEIYVPIDYSDAKSVVPPSETILYSTLMSGVYTFGPLKETWISHMLITTRGVAYSRPTITGRPPALFFAPWNIVSAPVKGRLTVKISALAYYNYKLHQDPNYETKEDFNLRFKHFGGKFRPLKKAFDKQWKDEKKILKAERKAEK